MSWLAVREGMQSPELLVSPKPPFAGSNSARYQRFRRGPLGCTSVLRSMCATVQVPPPRVVSMAVVCSTGTHLPIGVLK